VVVLWLETKKTKTTENKNKKLGRIRGYLSPS
jgi:hypothetical protein